MQMERHVPAGARRPAIPGEHTRR